jgi:5-methylthioribose kinase
MPTPSLFQGDLGTIRLEAERRAYITRLWKDTVSFAAAKMIRRILGLAHNIDLEWIKDEKMRATCEARALTMARDMMVNPANYPDVASLAATASDLRKWKPLFE